MELRPTGLSGTTQVLVDEGLELARFRFAMAREAGQVGVGDEHLEVARDRGFGAWRLRRADGTQLAAATKDDAMRERFALEAPGTRWRVERRAGIAHRRWEVLDAETGAVIGGVQGRGFLRTAHVISTPGDAPDGAVLLLAFLVGLMSRRDASAAGSA